MVFNNILYKLRTMTQRQLGRGVYKFKVWAGTNPIWTRVYKSNTLVGWEGDARCWGQGDIRHSLTRYTASKPTFSQLPKYRALSGPNPLFGQCLCNLRYRSAGIPSSHKTNKVSLKEFSQENVKLARQHRNFMYIFKYKV